MELRILLTSLALLSQNAFGLATIERVDVVFDLEGVLKKEVPPDFPYKDVDQIPEGSVLRQSETGSFSFEWNGGKYVANPIRDEGLGLPGGPAPRKRFEFSRVADGAVEIVESLKSKKGVDVRVSAYSSAREEDIAKFLDAIPLKKDEYGRKSLGGLLDWQLSEREMITIRGDGRAYRFKNETRPIEGLAASKVKPFDGPSPVKKNLLFIPGIDLDRAILIDDTAENALAGQERNLFKVIGPRDLSDPTVPGPSIDIVEPREFFKDMERMAPMLAKSGMGEAVTESVRGYVRHRRQLTGVAGVVDSLIDDHISSRKPIPDLLWERQWNSSAGPSEVTRRTDFLRTEDFRRGEDVFRRVDPSYSALKGLSEHAGGFCQSVGLSLSL